TMTDRPSRVELIPWDYESPEHIERMYLQRLDCGWRSEEVREKWTKLGRDGQKTLYWVESQPIHDTAPTHWHLPRTPTNHPFHPIGHIALDLRPDQDRQLGLSSSSSSSTDGDTIVWVAGLYVSHTLQAGGFGREVMHLAETIAAQPPLNGRWVVLDTMSREQQLSSTFVKRIYLAQGKPAPTVAIQDWYERQGYEVF
ncbi:hypothetical protein M406DRAFT_233774, partial [Cryphonectria parasitica EP155]